MSGDGADGAVAEAASARVLSSAELVSVILEHLNTARHRMILRTVCHTFCTFIADPANWVSVKMHLADLVDPSNTRASEDPVPDMLPRLIKVLPPSALMSLSLSGIVESTLLQLVQQSQLVELSLAGAQVELDSLSAAFHACGPTLRRLDISGLAIATTSQWDKRGHLNPITPRCLGRAIAQDNK